MLLWISDLENSVVYVISLGATVGSVVECGEFPLRKSVAGLLKLLLITPPSKSRKPANKGGIYPFYLSYRYKQSEVNLTEDLRKAWFGPF